MVGAIVRVIDTKCYRYSLQRQRHTIRKTNIKNKSFFLSVCTTERGCPAKNLYVDTFMHSCNSQPSKIQDESGRLSKKRKYEVSAAGDCSEDPKRSKGLEETSSKKKEKSRMPKSTNQSSPCTKADISDSGENLVSLLLTSVTRRSYATARIHTHTYTHTHTHTHTNLYSQTVERSAATKVVSETGQDPVSI